MELESKTAVVTGASSGIGAAIAEAMAGAGARVLLVGRDEERLALVAGRIREEGGHCVVLRLDVTSEDAPQRVVDEALAAFGSLDVLVHSAGAFEFADFESASLEGFDRIYEVNVRACFAITQAALPRMRPGGSVIFLSSISGRVGFARAVAYCMSKGAIELLTRALALEVAAAGVRVNAIAPGIILTAINEADLADPEYRASVVARIPLARLGGAEEVGPLAVFLASDAASYITGESITVDGGWIAR